MLDLRQLNYHGKDIFRKANNACDDKNNLIVNRGNYNVCSTHFLMCKKVRANGWR